MIYPHFPWLHGWAQQVTPLVYDESLSYEQQIARLFGDTTDLEHNKLGKGEFQEFMDWLLDTFGDFEGLIEHEMGRVYTKLLEKIEKLQGEQLTHNVVVGELTRSVDAMRAMYNDLAAFGLSVEELGRMDISVDGLAESGLNCRGLAMWSFWLACRKRPDYVLECDCAEAGDDPMAGKRVTVGELAKADILDGKILVKDHKRLTVDILANSDILSQYFIEDEQGINSTVEDVGSSEQDSDGFMTEGIK